MKILAATDLTSHSDAAVVRAGLLADAHEADLTLLHVVVPEPSDAALEQALRTAAAHLKARSRRPSWRARRAPNLALRVGNPARVIVDSLAQSRARLLVVGPQGRGPLRTALEGSIAGKALAAGHASLLVARTPPQGVYRRVLLALDPSRPSIAALRATELLQLAPPSGATIVYAHDSPYEGMLLRQAGVDAEAVLRYADGWRREAERSIHGLLHLESAHPARYTVRIETPPAPAGILRAIERHGPDLLVMGTRGAGRLRRALLGSVAQRVLGETSCDVLIVPQRAAGAAPGRSAVPVTHARRRAATELGKGSGGVDAQSVNM